LEVRRVDKYRRDGFPFLAVRRILFEAGARRVSREGVIAMIKVLEDASVKIAKESILIAHSSPHPPSFKERETITAEDIAIATHRVLSQS